MARLTPGEYDVLERAIVDGSRIAVWRRGTEYIVIPTAIGARAGRETIEARHPATGESLTIVIEEIEEIEVVR